MEALPIFWYFIQLWIYVKVSIGIVFRLGTLSQNSKSVCFVWHLLRMQPIAVTELIQIDWSDFPRHQWYCPPAWEEDWFEDKYTDLWTSRVTLGSPDDIFVKLNVVTVRFEIVPSLSLSIWQLVGVGYAFIFAYIWCVRIQVKSQFLSWILRITLWSMFAP